MDKSHKLFKQKSEISPHDRIFSTDIICDILDKYKVCYDGDKKYDDGNGCNNYGDEECLPRTQTIDRHGHPGHANSSNSKDGNTEHIHYLMRIMKDIYVNVQIISLLKGQNSIRGICVWDPVEELSATSVGL